ncbi:MAG: OsmC family protein [Novosphingobium sp.]|nr:OsmC family protein [Novosphingobium sp.]
MKMGRMLEVECKHLEGELMRVRFAGSQLIADHPFRMGGTESGPSPGEMMMMGLASASALAGRRFATQNRLDVSHIGARTSMSLTNEGFSGELHNGPLLRLSYVDRFWRRLEANGKLNEADRSALTEAMSETTVANTLANGITLDEELVCHRTGHGRARLAEKNPFYLRGEATKRLPEGEKLVSYTAENWRVSAAALDDETCLLKAVRSLWVAGSDIEVLKGPTPEELLLAALAACTTIFVARNSNLQDIPAESVLVKVWAELPDDPGEPISRFSKRCEVVGDLTDKEIADLEHMAYYCALGETLKRRFLRR